jgi:hypothetical protein
VDQSKDHNSDEVDHTISGLVPTSSETLNDAPFSIRKPNDSSPVKSVCRPVSNSRYAFSFVLLPLSALLLVA